MKAGRFVVHLGCSLAGALVVMTVATSGAQAQDHSTDAHATQRQAETQASRDQTNAFVRIVRNATDRFQDVSVAEAEGYELRFGCVSGGDFGAMGVHFVKDALVDGELNVNYPELLVYEPQKDGRLKLVAADYLVLADTWSASNTAPPELRGQLFHLFDSPNRFALPAFYTLHVWAWKDNPNGTFTNWNPNVSCDGFIPRT
jgi:hypothetical protein